MRAQFCRLVAAAAVVHTLSSGAAQAYCGSRDFVYLSDYLPTGPRAGQVIPVYLVTSGTHDVDGGATSLGLTLSNLAYHVRWVLDAWNNSGADVRLAYSGTVADGSTLPGIHVRGCLSSELCGTTAAEGQGFYLNSTERVAIGLHPYVASGANRFSWTFNPITTSSEYISDVYSLNQVLMHEVGHQLGLGHIESSVSLCTEPQDCTDGITDQDGIMNTAYPATAEVVEPRRADMVPLMCVWGSQQGTLYGMESSSGSTWTALSMPSTTSRLPPSISSISGNPTIYQSQKMAMVTSQANNYIYLTTLTNANWSSTERIDTTEDGRAYWRPGVAIGGGKVVVAWYDEETSGDTYYMPLRVGQKDLATGTWTYLTSALKASASKTLSVGYDDSQGKFVFASADFSSGDVPNRGQQFLLLSLTSSPFYQSYSSGYTTSTGSQARVYATGRPLCVNGICQASYVDTYPCGKAMDSTVSGTPEVVVSDEFLLSPCYLSFDSESALGLNGSIISSTGLNSSNRYLKLRDSMTDSAAASSLTIDTEYAMPGIGSGTVVTGNTGPPLYLNINERRFRVVYAVE